VQHGEEADLHLPFAGENGEEELVPRTKETPMVLRGDPGWILVLLQVGSCSADVPQASQQARIAEHHLSLQELHRLFRRSRAYLQQSRQDLDFQRSRVDGQRTAELPLFRQGGRLQDQVQLLVQDCHHLRHGQSGSATDHRHRSLRHRLAQSSLWRRYRTRLLQLMTAPTFFLYSESARSAIDKNSDH